MGYTFGAVEVSSRKFGKIIEDSGKRFKVLWSTSETSESGIPESTKVILNSPTFFNLVQPERNSELFDENPTQLVLEVLWESRALSSQRAGTNGSTAYTSSGSRLGALSTLELKSKLLKAGIEKSILDSRWAKIRKSLFSADGPVKCDDQMFWVETFEVTVSGAIDVDWEALAKSKAMTAVSPSPAKSRADKTPNLKKESVKKSGTAPSEDSDVTSADLWLLFISHLENNQPQDGALFNNEMEILANLANFDSKFLGLSSVSKSDLGLAAKRTKSSQAYVMAMVLAAEVSESNKQTARDALSLVINIVRTASQEGGELKQSNRLALARLLLSFPKAATSPDFSNELFPGVCALVLNLTNPKLAVVKESTVNELSKRIATDKSHRLGDLLPVMHALPWSNQWRRPLVSSLLRTNHPVLQNSGFWDGLDIQSLAWLSAHENWQQLINRVTVRANVQSAVNDALVNLSPGECLSALPLLDLLGPIASQSTLQIVITRALKSNTFAQIALSELANEDELHRTTKALEAAQNQIGATQARLLEMDQRLIESQNEIDALNARLAAASDQVSSLRDSERMQYQIDAAKIVARILATLDNELSPNYPAQALVQSQASRLGITRIFRAGDIEEFDGTVCDDPENKAGEGSTVRVISPGYAWHSDNQTLVLLRALVSL